jgi:hypothetical protein
VRRYARVHASGDPQHTARRLNRLCGDCFSR